MKTNFDTILEGQKKVLDLWAETTRSMADAFAGGIPNDSSNDFWNEWLGNQKKYWDTILHNGNLQNAFQRAPEDMKKWAEAQTEFAKKWMEFYTENASKYGFKNSSFDEFMKVPKIESSSWHDWLNQNNEWIQRNILHNLPFTQKFQFNNFKDLYGSFSHYWEYLAKMIEFGMTEWDAIGRFITPETYREIVGKFMGYKPAKDADELIKQTNEVFEKYMDLIKQFSINQQWPDNWTKMSTAYRDGQPAEIFRTLMDVTQNIKQGVDRFYNFAGQGKEADIIRLLKDLQFTYVAFILKSLELQTKVFEVSQPALPETLKTLSKEYQTSKVVPAFQTFFDEYLNTLEAALINLMESKSYASLQGELSKLAAMLKGKLDLLFELSMEGTPFMMKSFSNEVAKETAALRKRIRDLEIRLSEFDHPTETKKKRTTTAKS